MAQEPYNKTDKKTRLPKFNKNGGDDNSPKKGPRFSFYWVYAIIFAILIGFQLFGGSFSPNAANILLLLFQRWGCFYKTPACQP